MRKSTIIRNTMETEITLALNLDGSGASQIDTGCGFLDHMLTLFARHGRFDLAVSCKGDVQVDDHHSVEDIGICLGLALKKALGELRGVTRYGHIILPMDEALLLCAVDLSGRSTLCYGLELPAAKVGEFDCELVEEFFLGLVRNAGITLHLSQLAGRNTHHIIEGAFKAFGRALSKAVTLDIRLGEEIPSTKGTL